MMMMFVLMILAKLEPSCTLPMLQQPSVYLHHHPCRCDDHYQHHNDDEFHDDYGKTWIFTNQGSKTLRENSENRKLPKRTFPCTCTFTLLLKSVHFMIFMELQFLMLLGDHCCWKMEMVSFASILLSKFKFGKNSGLFTHSLSQKSENDKNLFFYRAMQNCIAAVSWKFCSTTQIPNS